MFSQSSSSSSSLLAVVVEVFTLIVVVEVVVEVVVAVLVAIIVAKQRRRRRRCHRGHHGRGRQRRTPPSPPWGLGHELLELGHGPRSVGIAHCACGSHCSSRTIDGSLLAPSMNSSRLSLPSLLRSIWRKILSVRFSGVLSSSGIFITEPTIL